MARIKDTPEAWDDRSLGADEEHAAAADGSYEANLDDALGLQSIAIRLPKEMIRQYKLIAHFHGVGYQPLMRDVLSRFVPGALKEILEEESQKAARAASKSAVTAAAERKAA